MFRPSPIKLKNLKAKNYLGSAKLLAATNPTDAYIGFSGTGGRAASSPPPPAEKAQLPAIEKLSPIELARKQSQSVSTGSPPLRAASKPSSPPPNIPLPAPPLPLSVQTALAKANGLPQRPTAGDTVRPLKIQKSSPDLRATRPGPQAKPGQLPRLDTDVARPAFAAAAASAGPAIPAQLYKPTARKSSIAPAASGNLIATTMLGPPSPPDSDYGEDASPPQSRGQDYRPSKESRRTTSDTTLVYRSNSNGAGIGAGSAVRQQQYKTAKRETEFMEELIGGYSATSLSPLPEQQQLLPPPAPTPQGQPRERVEKWASAQLQSQGTIRFAPANANGLVRNATNSSGPSGVQYASSRGANRRRAQTEGPNSYLNSRYVVDDEGGLLARSAEMVSFRLKLHFEDDIRGMVRQAGPTFPSLSLMSQLLLFQSLDADTSYGDFYTRLQTKFGIADMKLKYQDEDGVFVTLVDETDWDSAVAAAREHCPAGRQDGKLEIWVSEVRY